MHTFTDRHFNPEQPETHDYNLIDIAYHLADINRFVGSANRAYSVLEHSLLVAELLPNEFKLEGLLHDATEAYISDVPGPIKDVIPGIREYENRIYSAIAKKFYLCDPLPPIIKEADRACLAAEGMALKGGISGEELRKQHFNPKLTPKALSLVRFTARPKEELIDTFINLVYNLERKESYEAV